MALAIGVVLCASPVLRLHAGPASGPAPKFTELRHDADPTILALARRLDGARRMRLDDRPQGWAVLDLKTAPTLIDKDLTADAARRLNGFLPASDQPVLPAQPFILRADGPERDRAVLCLTQAIYYEAAREPDAGQRAVAQAVLNRVRHPNYPKSICGVVYQGAQQASGCQFTFTCDGSRDRTPVAVYWNRARLVAEQALSGAVMSRIGAATHYHADYVFPRWGPTLVKIGQIGAHIFYRLPGPAGQPASFRAPYLGGELAVSMAGPSKDALPAARLGAAEPPAPPAPPAADTAADAYAANVLFGRRKPTRDEIARINANLARMDQTESATIAR